MSLRKEKYFLLILITSFELADGSIQIPQNTARIPFECPRIPQNTNNIKILKDFGFLIFFILLV